MRTNFILILVFALVIGSCSEDTIDEEFRGSLTGTVIESETGNPLENAKVSTNPASSTVFTDENGNFEFPLILVDTYSVQAELETYSTGFESVTIIEDAPSNVAFELSRSNTVNDPPSAAELINPEDNAIDIGSEVEFAWNSTDPNDDDLTYTLELRNGATNELQLFQEVQDTTFTVTNLSLATNYFWQIKTSDGVNEVVQSNINSFTTTSIPTNPILFVKLVDGNNVIFSGANSAEDETNVNVLQISNPNFNSFRPKKNLNTSKVAFLRTVGGDTHIFTMSLAGDNVQQVTTSIPVAGFRQEELQYAWFDGGNTLLYPHFDKLYKISINGGGLELVYQTTDGSFISEVDVPEISSSVIAIKTNDVNGYNTRIFTLNVNTGTIENIIYQGELGASGGLDISANATTLLYVADVSGSQNTQYRRFENRLFQYNFSNGLTTQIEVGANEGENVLTPRYSPSEGQVIFTLVANNIGGIPRVFLGNPSNENDSNELFTDGAKMPNWE